MGKVIKTIDLLNVMTKGEIPKKIKYREIDFEYDKFQEDFVNNDLRYGFLDLICMVSDLNEGVEILDEEQEIDIQGIEEVHYEDRFFRTNHIDKVNEQTK